MNIKSQYQMRRTVMSWVLQIFSAKCIVAIFLGLLFYQYATYGVIDGASRWTPKPNLWSHLHFAYDYVLKPNWLWIVGAIIVDLAWWPFFFKDELR